MPNQKQQDAHELVQAARNAAKTAYCPYSNYPVGAALRLRDGRIVTGCNIENASYGLCNCAERTAIFKAVSEGRRAFTALAVCGGTERPAYPCGACRQVIAEFCPPDMPVYIAALEGDDIAATTVGELLPLTFSL
ncbi:MAG: cytidine deaminase [Kiritimatiellae bacterium]|nr:cytidine deaminase [Kiritimatiellia bacterium]